ncbi:MAG: hypothetical protein ABIK37_05190 [candidate division WOR-3 bacterium]
MRCFVVVFLLAAVLAGGVFAADATRVPLKFSGGTIAALPGTAACTTQAFSIGRFGYVSGWWNAFVNSNTGDSALFSVFAQYSYRDASANRFSPACCDTVVLACAGSAADTARSVARMWGYEFYPIVAISCRLIFQGLNGNSDSTYIDSVFVVGDPD